MNNIKFIKGIESITVRKRHYSNIANTYYTLVHKKGEKYRKFPFLKSKIAQDDLFLCVADSDIYPRRCFERCEYAPDENGVFYECPTVKIVFSDASNVVYKFETDDDAIKYAIEKVNEYGLREWKED